MLTIRAVAAITAIFVAALIVGTPVHASCESIYTGNCRPIPAKDPPEPAAEPEKASKPLQINRRNAARKAARERTAQTQRKRYARGTTTEHVLVLRQRRAKALASATRERAKPAIVAEDDEAPLPPRRSLRAPRRQLATTDLSATSGDATDGAAATDVLRPNPVATVPVATPVAAAAEQARPAPPVAASAPPVRTVAQSEVNEIDLAAADATPDPADQSWMRTLVLAFGGVLAAGTALRLFL
jgi:hypothetical protein